jgi:hypothetical protein
LGYVQRKKRNADQQTRWVEAKTNNQATLAHLVVLKFSAVAMKAAFGVSFMDVSNDSRRSFIFTARCCGVGAKHSIAAYR